MDNFESAVLKRYQRLLDITTEMLEVARMERWSELPALVASQEKIVGEMHVGAAEVAVLPESLQQQLTLLLGEINVAHEETTRRATACRATLAEALTKVNHSRVKNRRLGQVYGA